MSTTRRHVAIVNDDPVQLRLLSSVLESGGFSASPFLDAAEALTKLADGPAVDLFVVDLHMPGIDGWKLCHLLRSPEFDAFNEVPIIIVSATFTGDDVASITRELGANAFLEVPFDAKRLISYVERILDGEQPRNEPTILIVDDSDPTRQSLAKAFTRFGYRVLEADSAEGARALWAERRSEVVLLDYHLQDGSSETLLAELQDPEQRTAVLVMTGDTDPVLPVNLLANGADGYLRKPFDVAYAVEMVAKSRRQRALLRIETVLETRTRALSASEARYRSLFETIPDLVLMTDHEGRVVEVNPEGLRVLEASFPDVLGKPVSDLVAPEAVETLFSWLAGLSDIDARTLETELRRFDGTGVPVELRGRRIEHHGRPGVLLVGRDLTERVKVDQERRQLEAQVHRTQRLESLGVLAGGVAHDFNNLLVGILGNASLMMMDMAPDAPELEAVQQIEVSARRAAELTQQILVFAGRSKVASADVQVSELVRELGGLLEPAVSKKARMSYDLASDLPTVLGDPGQIRQVAMNLIMNASDALEDKPGDIKVKTYLREIHEGEQLDFMGGERPQPGLYVALRVTDQGCGISREKLNRIFEPFFTTKTTGRGLGLASTLGIVRAHHGFISVRSKVGRGSTFTVLLPPHQTCAVGDRDGAKVRSKPWKEGGRVLLVDDEPFVRGLARAVLTRYGFTVLEARDGVEAVARALDPAVGVAAVLLDLAMPRMDGIEALEHIRRARPGLPVLLSSGYPSDRALEEIEDDPLTSFMEKPYAPDDLVDAIQGLLWEARATRLPARSMAGD